MDPAMKSRESSRIERAAARARRHAPDRFFRLKIARWSCRATLPCLVAWALVLAPAGWAIEAAPVALSGVQEANMDRGVRPQDDLFEYANGTWLKNTAIPADRSRYGVDSIMQERSLVQQRKLLEEARSSSDQNARKAGDLYASFMDEASIERRHIKPLQAELAVISKVASREGLVSLMAHLDRIGVSTPLGTYVDVDAKDASRYAFWLYESGLGLPDRDYYSSKDAKYVAIRAKYQAYIASMLQALGGTHPQNRAHDVFDLESRIAALHWSVMDARDPQRTYNPFALDKLQELAPSIDWKAYLSAQGVDDVSTTKLIVREPDYFQGLSHLLETVPLEVWKHYLRFKLLEVGAPYLPKAFAERSFEFNEGVLRGTKQNQERWKRGVALVDRLMGEASGKLYVDAYFPPESKARADKMVANLFLAYEQSIDGLDWMSRTTKAEAIKKLRRVRIKIGYPDTWRDYGDLTISATDPLGNVFRANEFEATRKRSQLSGSVDSTEWHMTAPTVDAYYSPGANEMAFPAGILQLPLFNAEADDAFNYGSTGATIGHEMSHAFDNRGSQYDGDGNLRDWWTAEDHAKFKERTNKLVQQFSLYEPMPGYRIDGALTLSENIADLVGLEIAHKAYIASLNGKAPSIIDGMTADQRFFLGYAQSYMGKRREELQISQLRSNPHSPERYRVNGIVVNMQAYQKAFGLVPGDRMYLAPEKRVTIW